MSDIAERLARTALEDVSGYMLGEAADEICRLRAELAAEREKTADLGKQIDRLADEIDWVEDEVVAQEKALEEDEAERDALRAQLDEQQKTIDGLREELERSEKARKAQSKSFSEYYEKRDKFFKHLNRLVNASAFSRIDPKTASQEDWGEYTHEIRMHMLENGFCMNCESCNCFGDCYD